MNSFREFTICFIVTCSMLITHELGHFICAKLFKEEVFEFCIGKGPIIFRKGIFVLKLLPIAGCNVMEIDLYNDDAKKNLLILISGFIATSILSIFIYPFSKIYSQAIFVSSIVCLIFGKNSDGKLILEVLKNVVRKRDK